jgi:hypothetical protein
MGELQEFLEQEKEKRKIKPTPDNFDRLVREWQLQVKELYDQLETWLEPERKKELIDILRGYPVSVREEGLPEWEVDVFVIFFGELEIILKPESRFRGENKGVLKIETDKVHGKFIHCPEREVTGFNDWFIKQEDEKKPLTENNFKQTLKNIIKKAGKFTD